MKVVKLWFVDNKIYIETENGKRLWQSLLWYPRLQNATEEQRNTYRLSQDGIHWEKIDEDVSFESFLYPNPEPVGIAKIFKLHPELNVSAIARRIGIKQSLLAAYISGTKTPSNERANFILEQIKEIGKELQDATF